MSRELKNGDLIGNYEILSVLGQGGFGITYLAYDKGLDRRVAIKEYFPKEFSYRSKNNRVLPNNNDQDKEDFEWGINQFSKEAKSLTRFKHKNIVGAVAYFEKNNTAYLVMEYCSGQSLDQVVKKDSSLSPGLIKNIISQLLDGLEEVHKSGLLHRDLKPSNIFLTDDNDIVLLDFGSAKQALANHTRTIQAATEGYGAPEQLSNDIDINKQGQWTDFYGFGATVYNLITGEKPLSAISRLLEDKLIPLSARKLKYEKKLLSAIDACLHLNSTDRPSNANEFRALAGLDDLRNKANQNNFQKLETTEIKTEQNKIKKLENTVVQADQSKIKNSKMSQGSELKDSKTKKFDEIWVMAGLILLLFVSIPLLGNNNSGTNKIETGVKLTEVNSKALKLCKNEGDYVSGCKGTLNTKFGKYYGEIKNNKLNGSGELVFDNGGIYSGRFKDNDLFYGKFIPKNKEYYYEGYFRDFQPHGRATYFSGKRKLVGDYKDGKPSKGVWYSYPDCKLIRSGKYVNSKMVEEPLTSNLKSNYPC